MDEHKTALKLFFDKKRKLDRNRIKKKKQKIQSDKEYKYVVEDEKFLIQDKNDQEIISVIRKPKIVSHDQMAIYQTQIHNIQSDVLNMKYRLLFEYDSIDNMTMILNERIVPREKELEQLKQKEKKIIAFHEKLQNKKAIEELTLTKEIALQQLKEASTIDEKKTYIKEYIEIHKKIVGILEKTTDDLIEITPDIEYKFTNNNVNNMTTNISSNNNNTSSNNNTSNNNNKTSSNKNNNNNNNNNTSNTSNIIII